MDPVTIGFLAYGAYRIFRAISAEPAAVATEAPPAKLITFVGATGAGKSSTLNALLGRTACSVGAEHGTTRTPVKYAYRDGYSVQDTPGLMDEDALDQLVWQAVRQSELVIYTSTGQLYQPELNWLGGLAEQQARWDSLAGTQGRRRLALYVNKYDIKEASVSSAMRAEDLRLLRRQVASWIPADRVVTGASSPVRCGERQTAQIDSLRRLIQLHMFGNNNLTF